MRKRVVEVVYVNPEGVGVSGTERLMYEVR